MKNWKYGDIYNFSVEFNRIEMYNEYCKYWLNNYYNKGITNFESNTKWNINDIVDIRDYDRIKTNINYINSVLGLSALSTNNYQVNQQWTYEKANELESSLDKILSIIGSWQWSYPITGLATTGNTLRLGGV